MFDELLKIIYRSIKLDKNLYKDPKTFGEPSLYYACLIIILDGIAGAFAISSIYKTNIFMVNILTADKKNHYYEWQISKVEDESDLRDCWLTTAVSYPKLKEQGSITILDQI